MTLGTHPNCTCNYTRRVRPLRLRLLIAIGDVPLEAVTATNEAVDALIQYNTKDQALRGSSETRMPSSDAPHWHPRTGRPEPSTETISRSQHKACRSEAEALSQSIQTFTNGEDLPRWFLELQTALRDKLIEADKLSAALLAKYSLSR